MAEELKYSGLCETCKRDAICTLRRSTRLEIIRCEEYVPEEADFAARTGTESTRSRGEVLQTEMIPDSTRVTAFVCTNCARQGNVTTSAGRARPAIPDFGWPGSVQQIILPCAGRLQPEDVLKAFESGSSIVHIVSCYEDNCHYIEGSRRCALRIDYIRSILEEIGLGEKRLLLSRLPGSACEDLALDAGKPVPENRLASLGAQVAEVRDQAIQALRLLPPNPLLHFSPEDLSEGSPHQEPILSGDGANE